MSDRDTLARSLQEVECPECGGAGSLGGALSWNEGGTAGHSIAFPCDSCHSFGVRNISGVTPNTFTMKDRAHAEHMNELIDMWGGCDWMRLLQFRAGPQQHMFYACESHKGKLSDGSVSLFFHTEMHPTIRTHDETIACTFCREEQQ